MRNLILCLWLVMPLDAFAQTPHPWELGLGIGIATHSGETNQVRFGKALYGLNPSYSILLRKNIQNNFAGRINLGLMGLSGDDHHYSSPSWRQIRGLSFTGSLVELAFMGEFYPLGLYPKRSRKSSKLSTVRRAVSPFVALGIGGAYISPKVDWNDDPQNDFLDPTLVAVDKRQPYKVNLSIPMGIGARFRTGKRLTLNVEIFFSPTFSDYLDGISVAGDPSSNDWLLSLQAGASYAFGKGPKKQKSKSRDSENSDENLPDADADSVPDAKDACPDVPGLRSLNGCPDSDSDGVVDSEDHCPYLAGIQSLSGCPDTDGDGIADKDDHCPELKGVLAYQGCPAMDRDNDGVADADDLCPDMAGKARWKGCPDTDGDGLPDNKDGCPGIAGPQNLKGCPDGDGDGISDQEDECPTLAGSLEKNGCPDVVAPSLGFPYKAVYFGSTLQEWYSTSMTTLDEVVATLNADTELFARLEGHTDDTGKEPANDLLAEKRAKKCLDYITSKGIDRKRLNYVGYGSHRPKVPNDSWDNRKLNRRVEIYFYKKL